MFLIFLNLCLKSWYAINSDSQSISLPTYSFQIGGKFNISLQKAKANLVYIGLCTQNEFKTIQSISNIDENLCTNAKKIVNISTIVSIKNSIGSFSGNISIPGVYKTVFYTCYQTFSKYEISVIFQNPLSYLSADIQPCLISKPIHFSIFVILIILWIFNWAKNFTVRNLLHIFISLSILLNLSFQIVEYFEIRHKDKSNTHTILTEIKIILLLLSNITLFSVLLMSSKGWQIINESIKKSQIFICFLLSLLTVFPLTLLENYSLLNYEIPVMLVCAFFMALYLRDLMCSINRAIIKVFAHLLVITKSGIDASTTPIYYKYKMFIALACGLITYFLAISLKMIFSQVFYIPYWILEIFKDMLNLFVFSLIMWFFRLHDNQLKDYIMITNSESDEKPEEVSKSDVKSFKSKFSEFLSGTRKWKDGENLPLQPIVLETQKDRNENKKKKKIKAEQIGNESVDSIEAELL